MGREATCIARFGRKTSDGKALLETKEIVFRGDFRLAIPYAKIQKVAVKGDALEVTWPEGVAKLELGAVEAKKWLDRIRNPKTLIDKLDVKPGHVVSVVGIDDASFLEQVKQRAAEVSMGRVKKGSDVVFYGLDALKGLDRFAALEKSIARNGAIWAVWPKGRPTLKEDHVRAAAIRAGLVDVKVAAFSETHSSLKLVIPVAKR